MLKDIIASNFHLPLKDMLVKLLRHSAYPGIMLVSQIQQFIMAATSPKSFRRGLTSPVSTNGRLVPSGPQNLAFLISGWLYIEVASFVARKTLRLWREMDLFGRVAKLAYIDSRHSWDVASHVWLVHLIERSPKWQNSRDLDVTPFRGVREEVASSLNRAARLLRNRMTVKVTASQDMPSRPIFYRARDVHTLWVLHHRTVFRLKVDTFSRGRVGQEGDISIRAFCRDRKVLDDFLIYARDEYNNGFQVTRTMQVFTWDGEWEAARQQPGRSMESLFMADNLKEELVKDIEKFLTSENWYRDLGVPWKRGERCGKAPCAYVS